MQKSVKTPKCLFTVKKMAQGNQETQQSHTSRANVSNKRCCLSFNSLPSLWYGIAITALQVCRLAISTFAIFYIFLSNTFALAGVHSASGRQNVS